MFGAAQLDRHNAHVLWPNFRDPVLYASLAPMYLIDTG